jgi:glutathione synthase/RimK-type ligase-like ATP-grasp enzyme
LTRCAVAFLSTDDLTGYVTDDELARAPLRELGCEVSFIPWRAATDWDAYDVVVVRSTWDYQHDLDAFVGTLTRIDASRARLENPLDLMRWNMRKTYLRDLAQRGVPIAPTIWGESPDIDEIRARFAQLDAGEIILKPVIGASAGDVVRLQRNADDASFAAAAAMFARRGYLAQPYLPQIAAEGEFALIYIGGELSHTILKSPKAGDFRVQEEHGGFIRAVTAEPALLRAGARALAALPVTPLYARVDLVRAAADFYLMELELIEPSLYLRLDDGAPLRFARALAALC